ncbi:MAG TPA: BlaI/MecI/CopY family transcriptional regulator [Chitinophagaceae bacterium]|nr:BlaI/MecI/CopY family transcriptional regulator [Chitinophagaceae bacterium]
MVRSFLPKPTDSELEILRILWDRGPSSVRDVHGELEKSKSSGYTTTLKLMQIMLEKGILSRDVSGRNHVYTPTVSKDHTQQQMVDRMISTVFNGSPFMLVMQALGRKRPSQEEISRIKSYLNELEKERKERPQEGKKK